MPDQDSGATQPAGSAQVPPTRATGAESATGVAIAQQSAEIPQGEDRGSKVEPVGGQPKPDADAHAPTGAQAEPARFTSNGQLPHNTVPTPSGPVPVAAVAASQEHADKLVSDVNERHDAYVNRQLHKRLSAETVRRLGRSELQAIAEQRGYDMPAGGMRISRESFLQQQDENPDTQEA